MNYLSLAILFVFFFGLSCIAQNKPDYGKPLDLKGLTKVFVDTGTDLKTRKKLLNRLRKAKIAGLSVVDERDEAEILLVYRSGREYAQGELMTPIPGTPRMSFITGEGEIYVVGPDLSKPRLIMNFKSRRESRFEKEPEEKFIRDFAKAYLTANSDT